MGGRGSGGVEVRDGSIRVHFTYAGKARKETLRRDGKPLAPTPANEKHAHRLVAEIKGKIRHGVFEYADYFPDSKAAQAIGSANKVPTVKEMGALWIDSKGQSKASTLAQYRSAVNCWCELLGEDTLVTHVTAKVIKATIGKHVWPSAKTFNNYMIALRGMFELECGDARSPVEGVKNMRNPKKLPDPLTIDERDRILNRMRERYDIRAWAYFCWMFYTGMRPEEAIALRWGDIDFNRREVLVQRVRTFKGSEWSDTKTYTERVVDIVPQAMAALSAMKPLTFMKRDKETREPVDIFENPVTGRAWHDERSQRDNYWKPSLLALGIRERRAYATRHTFCTVALMGGVKPAYIAAQAGHSLKMLLEVYARWIPGNDNGVERRAMEAAQAHKPEQLEGDHVQRHG
jgi:integrase